MCHGLADIAFRREDSNNSSSGDGGWVRSQTLENTSLSELKCYEVDAVSFLNAIAAMLECQLLVGFGRSFGLVRGDMSGNVAKVRAVLLQADCTFPHSARPTLQQLMRQDVRLKRTQHDKAATIGLLWLSRALSMVWVMVGILAVEYDKPEKEQKTLQACAQEAYTATLSKHHNWIARNVVSTALRVLPSSEALRGDCPPVAFAAALRELNTSLRPALDCLTGFLEDNKLN